MFDIMVLAELLTALNITFVVYVIGKLDEITNKRKVGRPKKD